MKFALNYSPAAARLLQAGRIELDLWKCADWDDMVATVRDLTPPRPQYVHFPFRAGQNNLAEVGFERVERFMAATQTSYVNTHVLPRFSDLGGVVSADAVVEATLRDVCAMVDHFGAERVIVENVPIPESAPHTHLFSDLNADPAVMRRVVEASGTGFLLDLGHARRSATHFRMDPREYVAQLPVERLRELHITGVFTYPDGTQNDHMPMMDEDWALFDWALAQIRGGVWRTPDVVACEYGGIGAHFAWRTDPDVIAQDTPRMLAMVRAAAPAGAASVPAAAVPAAASVPAQPQS